MPCDCNRLCECLTLDTGEPIPWGDPQASPEQDLREAFITWVPAVQEAFEKLGTTAKETLDALEKMARLLGREEDGDGNPFPNGPPPLNFKPLPPIAAQTVPLTYRGYHRGQR